MDSQMRDRDLVLPPNTFAYVLDSTKGKVSVYVGPYKNSLSNTDQLMVWDEEKGFVQATFEDAIQIFPKAGEGQYVILSDPAKADAEHHPVVGNATDSTDLDAGRKIIIPGPVSFPLWPGQTAQTIDGHHLKSNQYLVVRIYEPEQAQQHADRALVARQEGEGEEPKVLKDSTFTMGELIVIKGTNVSFYIPSTGIEVLPDDAGNYVREAATLERLEYCILLDEDGKKRYMRGPDVVFPEPTEQFITDIDGNRKFKAIELNEQSGLYIKVIAAYEENEVQHTEGEETFITGKDTPIYFPREEHSIIQYGDKRKHHAIAIPKGEGRYVLDRRTGKVGLTQGPAMFLPDPRHEVIVRRILDPSTVTVMYPGNNEALTVNQRYAQEREARMRAAGGLRSESTAAAMDFLAADEPTIQNLGVQSRATFATPSTSFGGEKMRRGTEYTPPRTITLDTKYEGAVSINIWPGYAVLVTDKSGARRVESGPKAVLLEYDESLMQLSLSTGRPKTDHNLVRTVYLRTVNNQVSDQVTVETMDLVPVTVDLSYRVNFEGKDATKWFDIENYVQLLTDHCRSRLRNAAKRNDINTFYKGSIDIIRDTLLGEVPEDGGRSGLLFEENNMRLYDVEVVDVRIEDPNVGHLLGQAMHTALTGAIQLSQAEETAERESRLEALARGRIDDQEKTREREQKATVAAIQRALKEGIEKVHADLNLLTESQKIGSLERADHRADVEQEIELANKRNEIELSRMQEEATVYVQRITAIDGPLAEAIQAMGDRVFVEHLVNAVAPAALAAGMTSADMFSQIFKDTPFEGIMAALSERPFATNGGRQDDPALTH